MLLIKGIQTESQVDSGTNSTDEINLDQMLDEKCVGAPSMEARERQLPVDWIEERFRVDRRKLEEMILGKAFSSTRREYEQKTEKRHHTMHSKQSDSKNLGNEDRS